MPMFYVLIPLQSACLYSRACADCFGLPTVYNIILQCFEAGSGLLEVKTFESSAAHSL